MTNGTDCDLLALDPTDLDFCMCFVFSSVPVYSCCVYL